jgi:hypothetical protein
MWEFKGSTQAAIYPTLSGKRNSLLACVRKPGLGDPSYSHEVVSTIQQHEGPVLKMAVLPHCSSLSVLFFTVLMQPPFFSPPPSLLPHSLLGIFSPHLCFQILRSPWLFILSQAKREKQLILFHPTLFSKLLCCWCEYNLAIAYDIVCEGHFANIYQTCKCISIWPPNSTSVNLSLWGI